MAGQVFLNWSTFVARECYLIPTWRWKGRRQYRWTVTTFIYFRHHMKSERANFVRVMNRKWESEAGEVTVVVRPCMFFFFFFQLLECRGYYVCWNFEVVAYLRKTLNQWVVVPHSHITYVFFFLKLANMRRYYQHPSSCANVFDIHTSFQPTPNHKPQARDEH